MSALAMEAVIAWPTDSAITVDSDYLVHEQSHDDTSVTLGVPRLDALLALGDAYQNSREENWDGYGASRVEPETVTVAERFLALLLKFDAPLPDVSADADGDILLEWHPTTSRIYSVSIAANGVLSYAGIFGIDSETSGKELFRDELPASILEHLRRIHP